MKDSDRQKSIYDDHAEAYDRLVRREDADGNLDRFLAELRAARVAEVGCGTGRCTRLLLDAGAEVRAYDRAAAMVDVAREQLGQRAGLTLGVAAADAVPVDDGWADAAVAGWVFGHFRLWMPDDWRSEVDAALSELRRVTRCGGRIVVIETLGTMRDEPAPPSDALAEYYAHLEGQHRMTRTVLRTDYEFVDLAEADELARFFFGDATADRIVERANARVPEHTGVWSAVV